MRAMTAVLGLMLASGAAHAADIATEVTLFGQKYAIEHHSLAGKYHNGVTITSPGDANNTTALTLVQGDTPENDVLFVGACPAEDATILVDFLYQLKGTTPDGIFNQATSDATQYFGGAKDFTQGGRVSNITWISGTNAGGAHADLNLALGTFAGDDFLRFYDLDTLSSGDYLTDQVFAFSQRSQGSEPDELKDPGMPYSGFIQGVALPDGNVLFMGRGESDGPELGIFNPKTRKFFDVLTNVGTKTADQKIPFDPTQDPMDIKQIADNEYLVLGANPSGRGTARTDQVLYRVKITPPADLTAATPDSIGVEVEAAEPLLSSDTGKDPLGTGEAGITGMAVGRQTGTNGPRRLYFATPEGELITANPVQ